MARLNAPPVWLKPAAHLLAALPGLWLLAGWAELLWLDPASLRLSADPVAHTHNALGLQALRLLIATLAVTPLFRLSRWTPIMSLRRPLGLWAFAYAALHLAFYLAMELDFSLSALWREALKKPFIFFGLAAFLSLLPLAATSTRRAIKALGGRRWQALHRLVYVAGIAASIHFILRVKGFQPEPYLYAALLILLLAARLLPNRKRPNRAPQPTA
ncbi:sulfoxide reductase heme-binding subunit YedZ [Sandaracinobacter neustonicus]|uniref:Protein-methionine-sulfoxide reductase heme-binding subunit MsrQ n=1 Tax=Sandaracinobacter neustonicus TaxID=1715348 RepID=A0A501XNQ8_9SPHN|nr:protein-methionine-sulfoxide reductase heme-binding subunit MsrQ [Sandaracinobacter neustonicus]TPE62301.1 sulfoxide reductase heme-binding subunit YedZ [Sandaracinobacter neustonicus]